MSTREATPGQLVNELAGTMKKDGIVSPPPWAKFIKTGAHAQRPPDDSNWWYIRAASLLRQVYMRGPIGVQKLRNWYGGRKNRGARPERHYPAGGKIIRSCLQQLEEAGLVSKDKGGRTVTAKGQSLLDKAAASIAPRREKLAKKAAPKKAPAKKAEKKPKAAAKKEPVEPKAEAPAPKAAAPLTPVEPKPKPKEEKPKAKKEAKPKAEKPKEEKPKAEKPVKKAPAKKKATPEAEKPPAKAKEKPEAEEKKPEAEKAEEKD